MSLLDRLFEIVPWLSYLGSIVLLLAAAEVGHRVGTARRQRGETRTSEISTLESATLGLLALMIGFTFAVSLNRYDARRTLVLDEANAIGTTALRARLLPAPHAAEVLGLLREYVRIRVDLIGRSQRPAILRAAIDRSNALQERLWQQAMAVTAADSHSITAGLFVQALNDMIDLQEKRVVAAGNHAPAAVFVLLYGIAMAAVGFTGYSGALDDPRRRIPSLVAVLLIATVIGLVGDIDRPASGFVAISQKPMLDLMASLSSKGP